MFAKLLNFMGTDLTVLNAARVSFDKETQFWNGEYSIPASRRNNEDKISQWLNYCRPFGIDQLEPYKWFFHGKSPLLNYEDWALIHYLAAHNHWTPFGHPTAQFHIKAPIFVARQLVKHQVGLVWNEVSRRYVDTPPEFYWPDQWRKRASNKKQGSSDEVLNDREDGDLKMALAHFEKASVGMYNTMLEVFDVAPEMARMVLPQNMYTEWHWQGSLAAFARICKQRIYPTAQLETRLVAEEIDRAMANQFPVSWAALRSQK